MTANQQVEPGEAGDPLGAVMARVGGAVGFVAIFSVIHALLTALGYALKDSIADPAVLWPAAGFAFVVLRMARLSLWLPLLVAQFVVEFAVAALWLHPFQPVLAALYTLASLVGATVGAGLARWLLGNLDRLRVRYIGWFLLATAVGALADALIGTAVNGLAFPVATGWPDFLKQLQSWWAGNWLGMLVVAPIVLCWLSPLRARYVDLALRSRAELLLTGLVLVSLCLYVFSEAGAAGSLLQLPPLIVAVMVFAAMRLPPRWSVVLCAIAIVVCAALVAERRGPFLADDLFSRVIQAQAFFASLSVTTFMLALSNAETRITMRSLRDAEYRYRNFVELSTEAVWRVELLQPMPVDLPLAAQVEWLRTHARIVESSRSYEMVDARPAAATDPSWSREVPWAVAYEDNLDKAMQQQYSIDGLRFATDVGGKRHHFVTSFDGVVKEGRLLRIWGVARDITELTELNAQLLREQERLKTYARQLVTAEEKARRATAVDLHDGIGQTLVGMAMTLDVARQHAPSDVSLLIDEVRARLREVQERTRQMITDLSPPGLYELGLVPALQWLAVYMRGHDHLHVELDADVREEWVKLDMRVLVFKLVRELLRNVVKHAAVNEAKVLVRGDDRQLRIEVSDHGKGFNSQMDMFGTRASGFGLWSVADRAQEVGGRFNVDTAPGRGSRFELVFPLGGARRAAEQQRFFSAGGNA